MLRSESPKGFKGLGNNSEGVEYEGIIGENKIKSVLLLLFTFNSYGVVARFYSTVSFTYSYQHLTPSAVVVSY